MELPAYLRTQSLVIRQGPNELQIAEFDRWAEPLERGTARVFANSLRAAINVESVADNSRVSDALDFEVMIRISACEGIRTTNGMVSISFAATWEIRPVGTSSAPTKHGGFATEAGPWHANNLAELAMRLSEATSNAGVALAMDLNSYTQSGVTPSNGSDHR